MEKHKVVSNLLVFCLLLSILGTASNAYAAYNAAGAAAYAEKWANNTQQLRNPNWPDFPGNNCTNFVSQAVHVGGGWPQRTGPTVTTEWYCVRSWWRFWTGGWAWSRSWSVVSYFRDFLSAQGAVALGSWRTNINPGDSNPSIVVGDVLFYDFDGNGRLDHSSIVTAFGTDPVSGYSGDLICQNTTDRFRAIWHLRPYNAHRERTIVFAKRPR